MKVQVINEFGGPEVFTPMEIPKPKVIPGHVLVRVIASSVNPIDIKIRSGLVKAASPDFPAVLHGDISGIIAEVGQGVKQFNIGDEVYGFAGGMKGLGGALGEYILTDARLVAPKPKSLSFEETAALPIVALTAWEALVDRAKIRAQQKVLIHGATGGVSHVAIQIAKSLGALVYVTGSSQEKLDIAKSLGADVTINYKLKTVEEYVMDYTEGKGFDVVFDTVGSENLNKSFQAAGLNAKVLTTNARSTHDLSLLHAKGLTLHVIFIAIGVLHNLHRDKYSENLDKITRLVDGGKLRPLIDKKSFPFSQVSLAHQYLESGKAIGKVSLINDLGIEK